MPCSIWEEVAGKRCESCGGYATHYYGNVLLCCECHGGYLVSHDEAKRQHERILTKDDDLFHNKFSDEINKKK
jgi:hypothetical protein